MAAYLECEVRLIDPIPAADKALAKQVLENILGFLQSNGNVWTIRGDYNFVYAKSFDASRELNSTPELGAMHKKIRINSILKEEAVLG